MYVRIFAQDMQASLKTNTAFKSDALFKNESRQKLLVDPTYVPDMADLIRNVVY